MDTKALTFLFAIISLIKLSFEEECKIYRCSNLDDEQCSKYSKDNKLYAYDFKLCNSTSYCDWSKATADKPVKCAIPTPTTPKVYPGGACKTKDDCIGTTECTGGICVGKKIDEECPKNHIECTYGNACIMKEGATKKVCAPQLDAGAKCQTDYDCKNSMGCFKGICTNYFSLPLNDAITDEEAKLNVFPLCSSGFHYGGKCLSLKNVGGANPIKCTNSCKYTDQDGKEVEIKEFCECGYNPKAEKYCKLGSGEEKYVEYVNKLSQIVALTQTTKCHTLERDTCASIKAENEKLFQEYTNAVVDGLHFAVLADSDQCVANMMFPEYTGVRPVKKTCPRVSCVKEGDFCINSHSVSGHQEVQLHSCKNSTLICDYNPIDLLTKTDYVAKCDVKKEPTLRRLPGEECFKDDDCVKETQSKITGKCAKKAEKDERGTCTGHNKTETCVSDTECLKGTYCNGTVLAPGYCNDQHKKGETCDGEFSCKNGYACYNKTCTEYFSLSVGSLVDDTLVTGFISDPANLCKYGLIDKTTKKCVAYYHLDKIDSKSRLVPCDVEQKCNYTDGTKEFELDCLCGANKQGQGYCPKFHNDTSAWTDYYGSVKSRYTNDCHTQNRFSCYINDAKALKAIKKNEYKTSLAPLMYGADDCAFDVLYGSSSFVSMTSYLLVILFALLI